jgi:transcriptional regulator with XRE-family HTH domain
MLSTRQESYGADRSSQEWPWSARARLHSLADVQEPSIDLDREEYMARLGVVLQLARKAARIAQTKAAERLGMTPVSFTRWESGTTGISAYDLARLVRLYGLEIDADLVLNPPASKVEIRRRLAPIAAAAQRAMRRGLLRPLDDEDPGSDGEP